MKILTNAALILMLVSAVSCGKKSTDTGNSSISVLNLPLSGTWGGSGTQTVDGGAPAACQTVSVTFSFTDHQATMSNFNATCGSATVSQSALTLDMNNGALSVEGVSAGTITDQEIHLAFTDASGSYNADFVLTDATHMTYSENDSGTGHTYSASASLIHQ
ncbi:MAG: hypothetical protein ACXVA9_04140 [Bdellovibrionales bacterium]